VKSKRLNFALVASGIHLLGSLIVSAIVAWIVFLFWFPQPLGVLAGGVSLFLVLIMVDLTCGPILTAIVSDPTKSKKEQRLDWILIVVIQLGALIYGLYSISLARPVAVAFEVDRFVVVSDAGIDKSYLEHAEKKYQKLSWSGPAWVGVREPVSNEEKLKSIDLSMQGVEPSARPNWWQDINNNVQDILRRAHPLEPSLAAMDSETKKAVLESVEKTKLSISELSYLPLVSKNHLDDWSVLLDRKGQVVGYAPMSGFRE